ncbi:MAG: hypothetical protein ACK4WM_08340 [Thermoflexales bacterium]
MAEFRELFSQVSQVLILPLLLGLLATALLVSVVRNWRIVLPTMVVNYAVVGLMLARVIDPLISLSRIGTGAVAIVVLSVAAKRADDMRAARGESVARERLAHPQWRRLASQLLLRAMVALFAFGAAFGAASRFPLPGEARELGLAAYVLLAVSLLLIATAPEALNVGVGLLMLFSGFELAYLPLEPSIGVGVLMALVTLLSGLAIAYLVQLDVSAGDQPASAATAWDENLADGLDEAESVLVLPFEQPDVS